MLLDLPEGLDPDNFDVFNQMQEEGLDTETLVFVTEDEVDLAMSFGMQYIVKPFTMYDLMNRIGNISLLYPTPKRIAILFMIFQNNIRFPGAS